MPKVFLRQMRREYFRIPREWGGTGGRETGRKGGGRCTGGGRRGGGKRDSQGSGKREKKGKITQHCAIFRNQKNAKGREPKNTGREPGLKGTGSGRFKPPCPPPHVKWERIEACSISWYMTTSSCFEFSFSFSSDRATMYNTGTFKLAIV